MSSQKEADERLLPHHQQVSLCATRLPYRQGRKLTAVKAYTVNDESAHLLIFGVPSLNLRREAKDLFAQYGRLIQFTLMKDYAVEEFTETYHAYYDRIQSGRIAKKMVDTRSFYGGSLHVCYAPELETVLETRNKLLQRKQDVLFRLKNLQRDATETKLTEYMNKNEEKSKNDLNISINESNWNENESSWNENESRRNKNDLIDNNQPNTKQSTPIGPILEKAAVPFQKTEIINEVIPDFGDFESTSGVSNITNTKMLNMGESNVIYLKRNKNKRKKKKDIATKKRFKAYFDKSELSNEKNLIKNDVDVIDCTSTEKDVVSNINEALNYNKFGNEVIKHVETKPLNKIVFNVNKKSL